MYYTVYKIENKINGKCYIGKHKTTDLDDDYFGSGSYLNHAIDDWGIENFEKTILCLCSNESEMDIVERAFIAEYIEKGIKLYNIQLNNFKKPVNKPFNRSEFISTMMKEKWANPEWVQKRKPTTKCGSSDKKKEKKEKELQNKINDVDVKAFENKPKVLKELFGFSERDLRDHRDKIETVLKEKGFNLYDVELRNKHRQLKQKSIWAIDDESLIVWAGDNSYRLT